MRTLILGDGLPREGVRPSHRCGLGCGDAIRRLGIFIVRILHDSSRARSGGGASALDSFSVTGAVDGTEDRDSGEDDCEVDEADGGGCCRYGILR